MRSLKGLLKVRGWGQGCVAVRYLTPYFGYIILPHVDRPAQCLVQRKSKRNIQKEKIETDKRRKHFFHTFLYLLGEWTNQRYVPRRSVVPKTPDSKMMLLVPDKTRFTENLSIYFSPPAPNSPLQNPSNFGETASHWLLYFLLFFFFLIFNRMDAWSLMRGDAFIHFVCGSQRVNIRLGVLLLIPKSPQIF